MKRQVNASRSQHAEDIHAFEHYFYGLGGGTFLEMGALNGVQWSNTVALERVLGWRGILIEASPSSYSQLATNRLGQVRASVIHRALACVRVCACVCAFACACVC